MRILLPRRGAETPRRSCRLSACLRVCGLVLFAISSGYAQALLYIGAWPKQILVIDEAQQKVVDHIQLETGTPRHIEISYDRKKLFATTCEHRGGEVIN